MDSEMEESFEVYPGNWEPLQVFLGCATQWWRNDYTGHRLGLMYESVDLVMRRYGVDDLDACFCDVQVLEFAALEALNEAAK